MVMMKFLIYWIEQLDEFLKLPTCTRVFPSAENNW